METSKLSLDLDKICRVCLRANGEMFSIYSELYEEDDCVDELPKLSEIITSISSMKIEADDDLPKTLCVRCVKNAYISFKFRQTCDRSQGILENYVKRSRRASSIKIHLNKLISEPTVAPDEDDFDPTESYIEESPIEENTDLQTDPLVKHEEIFDTDELYSELLTNEEHNEPNGNTQGQDVKTEEEENTTEEGMEILDAETIIVTGEGLFACNACDKAYKNRSTLRAHIRGFHGKTLPYKCEVCGKRFRMYNSLFYHKRTHTGEQPYACKICDKRYRQPCGLTAHMRVHTGQRPFQCKICGNKFSQQTNLTYHMRTHTKEKPYQCALCGKRMTMQSHLVQHMRAHTGERPFPCTECDKAFPSTYRLKCHLRTHTGEKPYECDVCGKAFNRSSALNVHRKTHTDERPHVCPICNKGFIQVHSLRTHILKHDSETDKKN